MALEPNNLRHVKVLRVTDKLVDIYMVDFRMHQDKPYERWDLNIELVPGTEIGGFLQI